MMPVFIFRTRKIYGYKRSKSSSTVNEHHWTNISTPIHILCQVISVPHRSLQHFSLLLMTVCNSCHGTAEQPVKTNGRAHSSTSGYLCSVDIVRFWKVWHGAENCTFKICSKQLLTTVTDTTNFFYHLSKNHVKEHGESLWMRSKKRRQVLKINHKAKRQNRLFSVVRRIIKTH